MRIASTSSPKSQGEASSTWRLDARLGGWKSLVERWGVEGRGVKTKEVTRWSV